MIGNKLDAAHTLSDEISGVYRDLEKAEVILNQMFNDFFDEKFSREEPCVLFYQFNIERTYAHILLDYLCSAARSLEALGAISG